MQKNVAAAPRFSSRSSTRGVISGSGPSSKVSATSPRAAAAAGSRTRFGPSTELRGIMHAAKSTPWFATSTDATPGQSDGCATIAAAPAACSAAVTFSAGYGFQRRTAPMRSLIARG